MKLKELNDYNYTPDRFDLTNFFNVEEVSEKDGSISTFFNLNESVTIDGIEDMNKKSLIEYKCRHGDNLRFISYRQYGSIHYWWMIAKINHIDDVFEELTPGRTLYLLPIEHMNYMMDLICGRVSGNA